MIVTDRLADPVGLPVMKHERKGPGQPSSTFTELVEMLAEVDLDSASPGSLMVLLRQLSAMVLAVTTRLSTSAFVEKDLEGEPEPLLKEDQVAKVLNVPESYVGTLARAGLIRRVQVGKKYKRFTPEAVSAFIAKHQKGVDLSVYEPYTKPNGRTRAKKTSKHPRTNAGSPRRHDGGREKHRGKVGKKRDGNLGARVPFRPSFGGDRGPAPQKDKACQR